MKELPRITITITDDEGAILAEHELDADQLVHSRVTGKKEFIDLVDDLNRAAAAVGHQATKVKMTTEEAIPPQMQDEEPAGGVWH